MYHNARDIKEHTYFCTNDEALDLIKFLMGKRYWFNGKTHIEDPLKRYEITCALAPDDMPNSIIKHMES